MSGGTFKSGADWRGNPGGRVGGIRGVNRFAKRIREATRDGQDLVDTALAIMRDQENSNPTERMAAVKWLADRAFGRSPEVVLGHVTIGPRLDVSRLSDAELDTLCTIAERAMPSPGASGTTEEAPTFPPSLRALAPHASPDDDDDPPEAA